LVDLERSEVVDLLPTRSAKALGEWLAKHPEVMVVSRDRQGSYAEGTRCAAPEAVQIADRFHLTLNLRQAVERELAVRRPSCDSLRKAHPFCRLAQVKKKRNARTERSKSDPVFRSKTRKSRDYGGSNSWSCFKRSTS
jgi:transposase